MAKGKWQPFEKSQADNDKGVKEGGKADLKRDRREKAKLKEKRRGK